MKKELLFILLLLFTSSVNAQIKLDDFGRIVLNTYISDEINIADEAKKLLSNKLSQFTSNNGMGGSQVNPQFIITAKVNIGTKDIIAGPPQMIAQNVDVTLYIGDAITNTIFSNVTLSLKGVGTNENKAFIEAFKAINSNNKEVKEFLEAGKNKIINYYSTNCDFMIKDAQTLVNQEKYDEAIYKLSLVPEVCQDCYFKSLDYLSSVYQQKIDAECKIKLNDAKVTWTSAQNPTGAEKAGDILSTINAMASCQPEVDIFIKAIDAKLKADEKARWQFKMKQYADKIMAQKEQVRIAEEKSKRDDMYRENQSQRDAVAQEKQSSRNFELDKLRANSYREVALEQARNQPKTVTYNNFYLR
jgi:hypothetical protein